MDPVLRAVMERHLGQSVGAARLHTDAGAASSARAINAQAYTVGRDVVFGDGAFAPDSAAGRRLLAHELTHVAQQAGVGTPPERLISHPQDAAEHEATAVSNRLESALTAPRAAPAALIQRNGPEAAPADPPKLPETHPWPTTGESVTFRGVLLTENPDQLREEMIRLVATGQPGALLSIQKGIDAPIQFLSTVRGYSYGIGGKPLEPTDPGYQEWRDRVVLHSKILPVLTGVVEKLHAEQKQFLDSFESAAKDLAQKTLDANWQETETERVKYGITEKQIEIREALPGGVSDNPEVDGSVRLETQYGMDEKSPAALGLQSAAGILLKRRQEIDSLVEQRKDKWHWEFDSSDPEGMGRTMVYDPEYYTLGKQIDERTKEYKEFTTYLSSKYPVLASFAEIDRDISGLAELAASKPGPDMARLIAGKIAETREKIQKVRDALNNPGEVNIWRQERMVGLTRGILDVDKDAVKKALVDVKVQQEKPGILADLALLVLNVAALILAAPTGGISLAVAAGVNVAVTATHIQEYILKEAMAGSAFSRAKAISQEEPSLFWLAVEIVGTAVDVGMAGAALLKTFKTLAPLVKAAETAKDAEEAARSTQAIRAAAGDLGNAELGERVVARMRQGESSVLKAVEASPEELAQLAKTAKTAELEAAETVGKAVQTASGEVNLSKAGHLFTCSSPCTVLRERYVEILAKDAKYEGELRVLEQRAKEAAEAQKAAEKGTEVARQEAEKAAEAVKRDAADLERRMQKSYPETVAAPEDPAVVSAVKEAEAEAKAAGTRFKAEELTPPPPARPSNLSAENEGLWKNFEDYYKGRYEDIANKVPGAKPPLKWDSFEQFLGKFRRGTSYQAEVRSVLEAEAKAGTGTLFKGMKEPEVLSNVGVAGKEAEEGAKRTTKYVDQLVVDKATIGEGLKPNIEVFSNKSRVFPEKLTELRQQVLADAAEATSKYGGKITIRRPDGPLKPLFNETVDVSKVTLVYDAAPLGKPVSATTQTAIRNALKGTGVEVIFL